MAQIDLTHYFELPLDEYIRMIFDPTEEEEGDLTELPNVQEREEVERFEDDKIIRTVVRYFAIGFIPPRVRAHLKPHMLSWLEHTTYNKAGKYWEWRIEPHFFKELLKCRGRMSLSEEGKRTKRVTKGMLKIRVPLIGSLAEKLILDHLVQNFDAESKMFHDMLRRLEEEKNKTKKKPDKSKK